MYLILAERYVTSCYFLSHLYQVLLDVLHNYIAVLVRQDLTDHIAESAGERNASDTPLNPFKCIQFLKYILK